MNIFANLHLDFAAFPVFIFDVDAQSHPMIAFCSSIVSLLYG